MGLRVIIRTMTLMGRVVVIEGLRGVDREGREREEKNDDSRV